MAARRAYGPGNAKQRDKLYDMLLAKDGQLLFPSFLPAAGNGA